MSPKGKNVEEKEGHTLSVHDQAVAAAVANAAAEKIPEIEIADIAADRYTEFLVASNERAVPDARDGLKPVQRRILLSFKDNAATATSRHYKSVKIVGDTLGRYHPHGDSSVYDAAVTIAQNFAQRYPLIDFQGNVGSIDGDPAAAYRYTEMRPSHVGDELLRDLENRQAAIVEWGGNFTNEYDEAYVLPGRFPALLTNGIMAGIGTGYSSMWLPHNLREVIDAVIAVIEKPSSTHLEIAKHIKGPDFPTGGTVVGIEGFRQALETGRGSVTLRAKIAIEESGKETKLIVTEIPWQKEKTQIVEQIIAATEKDKNGRSKIDGIADVADESGKEWRVDMRIAITLKRDANAKLVANLLYKETGLQSSFTYNQMAYVDGYPELLSMRDAIGHYVAHQIDVLTRRTKWRKLKAEEALEVQEAYLLADKHANELVPLAKKSANRAELEEKIPSIIKGATKRQCEVIAGMPLYRFSKIDTEGVKKRIAELTVEINEYKRLLGSDAAMRELLIGELREIKTKHGDERRTEIDAAGSAELKNLDEMLPDEPCWFTLSNAGLISRLAPTAFRVTKRGASGVSAAAREDDPIVQVNAGRTRDRIWIITNQGNLFSARATEIDEVGRGTRGTNVRRFLSLAEGEAPVRIVIPPADLKTGELLIATAGGRILRSALTDYANLNAGGLRAIKLVGADTVVGATLALPKGDVITVSSDGYGARFALDDLPIQGRGAQGVTAMKISAGARLISAHTLAVKESRELLIIASNGRGKRTSLGEYPQKGRAIRGVMAHDLSGAGKGAKVEVAVAIPVAPDDLAVLATASGQVVATPVSEIRKAGRVTAGVSIVAVASGDRLLSGAVASGE
jgi:DNA gyrase subunit A